ncbi:MAG TPA: (2Fe-2S) ferredoxin domain-containing protein [Planctomycetota bacterium]|nr:(2Fe-2S) ferredoxin domain-containing protein [Planctomycetota bacterium]
MSRFRCHLFVCTNRRPDDNPKGSCAAKGSEAVLEALKLAAHAAGLKGQVRVNKAGCLDACEHGVAAVAYPAGIWYRGLVPADAEEIVQRTLVAGEAVERLLMPPAPSRPAAAH